MSPSTPIHHSSSRSSRRSARGTRLVALVAASVLSGTPGAFAQSTGAARPPATVQPGTAQTGTGEAWQIIQPAQVSVVLGRDGSVIGIIGRERRLSVPLRTLPKFVSQAVVAVEDKRF